MASLFRRSRFRTIPTEILQPRVAGLLLLLHILLGITGFHWLEAYSLREALYMTMITISTVGFTEVQPLGAAGQWFATGYIFMNFAVTGYVLAVFGYYFTEGELFKRLHMNTIKHQIERMEDHVIICGFGRYGREIADQLRMQEVPYLVIDQQQSRIDLLLHSKHPVPYLLGDGTEEDMLRRARIFRAKSLIITFPDDADCVFAVLTARQLCPTVSIISRVNDVRSASKLSLAGANHVIRPEQVGGYHMAMLTSKPGAIEFFGCITRDVGNDISFEEITYEQLPPELHERTLDELDLRGRTGVNVVGYREKSGQMRVNPPLRLVLQPGDSLIVLGDRRHLRQLHEHLQLP